MSEKAGPFGTSSDSLRAIVVMGFDERLTHIYQRVIKPTLEGHGFNCLRGDEIQRSGWIIDQIKEAIAASDLVFCDLTFENPNVFYEVAIAHMMEKTTLMISQHPATIPFDVRHWRVIPYEDSKLGLLDLRDEQVKHLNVMFPMGERQPYSPHSAHEFPLEEEELESQRTALMFGSYEFKRFAVKYLGDCRDLESFGSIEIIATGDNSPDLRRDAFTALQKIDPKRALPILLNEGLRNQADYLVRERVVSVLGSYMPHKTLVKQLIMQLGDSSWGVRRACCEVLGRWGDRMAIGPLQNMQADTEPQVRFAALEALDRLQQGGPPFEGDDVWADEDDDELEDTGE